MDSDMFIERDGVLIPMVKTAYGTEDELQHLLELHSELLAGRQTAEPVGRIALIKREAGVPDAVGGGDRWSLDHLFIDQYGVPTLVEVKRATDTRIRREVVGQMLDYAANAALHWTSQRLRDDFESTCATRGIDPMAETWRLLGGGDEGADDDKVDQFWQQVSSNLRSGHMRLLFVADQIPAELRRIIEFLNERMNPTEVLGVEVRHYTGGGMRLVSPSVVGRTAVADQMKGRSSPADVPVADLVADAPVVVQRAVALLADWATSHEVRVDELPKSLRYSDDRSDRTFAYLYPGGQWEAIYFDLRSVDGASESASIRASLDRLRGEPTTATHSVSVSCSTVVDQWQELETVLLPTLLHALRSLP